MCAAGHVIDKERFVGRNLAELLHVLNRVIGHRRGQIPARIPGKRVDGRRVAEQVRLPLAGVATDEAVEILEAHPNRPLIERPGLARQIKRRIVVLTEPRRRVPVLLEDCADRTAILPDDRIVARKPCGRFTHHAKAGHVMVASSDQRRAGRRTQRSGMECI
jgi:hypothetical protein